jgi:hypothetical protein
LSRRRRSAPGDRLSLQHPFPTFTCPPGIGDSQRPALAARALDRVYGRHGPQGGNDIG